MLFQATPPPDEAAKKAEEQALLKEELHVAATMTQARIKSDNLVTDLTNSEKEYKQLEQQLNSSVVTSKIPLDECEIGNWKGCWIYTPEEEISQFSPVPSKAHQLMPHSEVEIHSVDFGIEDVTKPFSSGSYDFENRKLIINKFNIDEAVRKKVENNNSQTAETLKNNPCIQLSTAIHETLHKKNIFNDGMLIQGDTPVNAAKKNRLTETLARASEYLSAAHLYTEFTKQGVTQLEMNGRTYSLDSLLSLYPNLPQTIKEHGFDVNNPESIRNVVQASSDYWHKEVAPLYEEQHANAAAAANEEWISFNNQLQYNKRDPQQHYDKVSNLMLKNVYIGNNTYVDLTHCRDLLDTLKDEEAEKILTKYNISQPERPTQENLQAVNNYLEQHGAHTDQAKQALLETEFKKIVTRNADADKVLKDIMLSNGGSIKYSDGLIETHIPNSNLVTIGKDNGKTFVVNSFQDFSQKRDQARANENSTSVQKEEKSNSNNQLNQQQMNYLINQAHSR